MLRHALKEWAVVIAGMAEGRQSILLRKGGIAEPDGRFLPAHDRFWLFPTYLHQERSGIVDTARPLFDATEASKPPAQLIELCHLAQLVESIQLSSMEEALALANFHVWSPSIVAQRFAYRQPGLHVLVVRTYAMPRPHALPNVAAYEGCRSWVELAEELDDGGAAPVLEDATFEATRVAIRQTLASR